MISRSVVERINSGEMKEDEFWFVALEFAEIRSKIESFFKVAKTIFGLKDLHLYYRKYAITEIKTIFYATQLFCQFCLKNRINMKKFVERIKRRKL
ncbi:hypothetical protein FHEFKHOI_00946 [Candidatus Methanoperedenaceae archaeon GB50]|nr:hypothetical protein AIOGIFDO_00942 [Candidatus Methanoperedenaceae archaeon GB37]CAD7771087.1 hypothetical protein FHEFKHOI_00946 [Candidatus Methanoperedenaceae archaeon GB50]CAD7778979.1 MAG: hypothetical protein KBONHNOK_01226 [Candidatus Methanoperedenaceae archaeon GB50]